MQQVAVTGYGIVSPLGGSVAEFSRKMFAGESGIRDVRGTLVARDFPVAVAGKIPRSSLHQIEILEHLPPEATPDSLRFAGQATLEALAALPPGHVVDAVVYATSDGVNFDLFKESFRKFDQDSFEWSGTRSETCLELIRSILDQRGNGHVADCDLISINNACVSGNQAIGIAFQRIRSGAWTRAIVGGVDARCNDHNFMNFHLLGALAVLTGSDASRPFSGSRCGFVRGEGAATLLLESQQSARARGATPLGFVTGYSATSDAYRLTDGRTDLKGAVRAMESAIRDAGCGKNAISAISAHGTSTKMNDALETAAIKQVFGARAYKIPVTSLKSQVGHSTVAAGALEAISCLEMLRNQRLAPTINYQDPDPECDLDYVPNVSRPASLETILSNNFGFGGQNSCVIFKAAA